MADASQNNPKKEMAYMMVGIAGLLGLILLIGVSGFLRPAGEHIQPEVVVEEDSSQEVATDPNQSATDPAAPATDTTAVEADPNTADLATEDTQTDTATDTTTQAAEPAAPAIDDAANPTAPDTQNAVDTNDPDAPAVNQ